MENFIELGKTLEHYKNALIDNNIGFVGLAGDSDSYYSYFEDFQAVSLLLQKRGFNDTIKFICEVQTAHEKDDAQKKFIK